MKPEIFKIKENDSFTNCRKMCIENIAPIISVRNLSKSFDGKVILKDINLDIYPGEVVSVIGSSGSGKSTMIRCINRLEEPTRGDILFEGVNIVDRNVNINKV